MDGRDSPTAPDANCSVVTVGTYDGVHLGHRRLIEETRRAAAERGCRSVVVTFDQHPSKVLRPDAPVPMLCSLEEKLALLRETGIDEIVVLAFDEARAHESAEEFVVRDLVGRLAAREVVVGSNFRFGYERRGDVALLQRMGAEFGFATRGIELVLDDEHHSVVSSTRIRALIQAGEMLEASRLLGRPYELRGIIGANLRVEVDPDLLVPPPGRYTVEVAGNNDRSEPAAVVIGDDGSIVLDREGVGRSTVRSATEALKPDSDSQPDSDGALAVGVTLSFRGDREPLARADL